MPAKRGGRRPGAGRRPDGDDARNELVKLRVTSDERRAWEVSAASAGTSLSEWIREQCAKTIGGGR